LRHENGIPLTLSLREIQLDGTLLNRRGPRCVVRMS